MRKLFLGVAALAPICLSAQGLYSIAPNDDEAADSLPLTWTAGLNVGYDDNVAPLSLGRSDEGSLYISPFISGAITSVSPQTTWDVYARLGMVYYLDAPGAVDDAFYNAAVGVNFTKRVNERLRFSSRNNVAYELEPDLSYGFLNDRGQGSHFRYISDNTVGYRWSERFATITGVRFSGVLYDDEVDGSDFHNITLSQQFRYRVSPVTVLTASYRYGMVNSDGSGDSSSHYLLGGVEHRISPTSAIVFRAGAQITDPDNGSGKTVPFVEAALRSSLTEQLSAKIFARYSSENYNRSIQYIESPFVRRSVFETNQTFRFGLTSSYTVNPQLTLFAGANIILSDYEDIVSTSDPTPFDGSESRYNFNIGGSYQVRDNLFLTGSYNFTTADSDFGSSREYDRNRVQLGVQTTF